MGGMPPQGQEHEGRDPRAAQARGHWLAHLLGEEWRSDGDGIYRLASAESEPAPSTDRPATAAPNDVDELIAELSADLVRHERPDSGAVATASANGDRGPDRH